MVEVKNNIKFIPDQDRIPGYKFPDYSVFFQTDTCIGNIKRQGIRKFCPNSKNPDKSRFGLTRSDCNW